MLLPEQATQGLEGGVAFVALGAVMDEPAWVAGAALAWLIEVVAKVLPAPVLLGRGSLAELGVTVSGEITKIMGGFFSVPP